MIDQLYRQNGMLLFLQSLRGRQKMVFGKINNQTQIINKYKFQNSTLYTAVWRTELLNCYYRAMHSAKRGIDFACSLSVCPSVTLMDQDHIRWKSWKLIARTITQHSRSLLRKCHPPTHTGTWGKFGKTRGETGKSGVLEHKNGNLWNA